MSSLAVDSENGNFWFDSLDSFRYGFGGLDDAHESNTQTKLCEPNNIRCIYISLGWHAHRTVCRCCCCQTNISDWKAHTTSILAIHSMCVRIYGDDDEDDSGGDGGGSGDNSGGNGGWFGFSTVCVVCRNIFYWVGSRSVCYTHTNVLQHSQSSVRLNENDTERIGTKRHTVWI